MISTAAFPRAHVQTLVAFVSSFHWSVATLEVVCITDPATIVRRYHVANSEKILCWKFSSPGADFLLSFVSFAFSFVVILSLALFRCPLSSFILLIFMILIWPFRSLMSIVGLEASSGLLEGN